MRKIALALLLLAVSTSAFASVKITIQNNNDPGVGFNDTTPATPVGGNPGTTRGQQRLNAFQHAADIWGSILDSNVEIIVQASMVDLDCTSTSAVLGQARAFSTVANFPSAPKANTNYPVALANKLAGSDLTPGTPHIFAQFNARVDNNTCLNSGGVDENWYYGFDANHGKDIDLVAVVLHEIGHGLGFASGVSSTTGNFASRNFPNAFDLNVLDNTTGLRWTQMDATQRLASITNTGHLVWDGPSAKAAARTTLRPVAVLSVTSPAAVARNYDLGFATFGPAADASIIGGRLVQATDDAGSGSALDGCSVFTNAAAVSGKVAVVDRGNCNFIEKAKSAQAAGAKALVVIDNTRTTCLAPGMGNGGDETVITIPTVSINALDGDALKAQLAAGIDATIRVDTTFKSGLDGSGNVRLYAPCQVVNGSSVSHWDVVASPNLLMEPSINDDLTHNVDITVNELIDVGWSTASQNPVEPLPPTGRRILRRGH